MNCSGPHRLLIAASDFPPAQGGIQRMLHEITHRLAERWTITVVAPRETGSAEYDASAPFRILRTKSTWREGRAAVLYEMTRLTARKRPDIVLAGHLNTLPALLLPGRGRPRVALVYGSELWAGKTRLLTRVLGHTIDCALAISSFTAAEAAKAGIGSDRILLTPPGANPAAASVDRSLLTEMRLVRDGEIVPFLVTVSRLDERHKGHDVVLRALPELLDRTPNLRYVIAGDGELADEILETAHRLGVAHAVVMPGAITETLKSTLLASCRAYVMLSRESHRPALFEGFGIAFIEAAMAGRPVIAGRTGGVPDAVIDGQTGLLVDPTSVPRFVAAALRLLEDSELADALGAEGRKRALRDFTWQSSVTRIEHHMEGLL